ncbi:uncharacterized protein V1516DRAFT_9709 [Lipomyces oligophaga]|uniref:uncharacterized protein n=1 Tax=Lipomyces oligophaga TaxID=45792 RepID=UPI0034CF40AD
MKSLVLIIAYASLIAAHSWIDVLYATDTNGTIRSTGYIRNFQGHIDADETYHLMDPYRTTALCMSSQQSAAYSDQYPMLVAGPGDNITATYLENGHVTLDMLAPDNRPHPGQYVWLWTGTPDTELSTVSDIFDENYILAGPSNFDDGKCAVAANNPFGQGRTVQPCVSQFYLPTDIDDGVYSIAWVWHFPKIPACEAGTIVEFYTSCADIKISSR